MARVFLADVAKRDIRRILSDLDEQAGLRIAANYAAEFKKTYRRLADFPASGPPRPHLGSNVRIAIVLPYIVFYEHTDDVVTVLRFLHGKRNITREMMAR